MCNEHLSADEALSLSPYSMLAAGPNIVMLALLPFVYFALGVLYDRWSDRKRLGAPGVGETSMILAWLKLPSHHIPSPPPFAGPSSPSLSTASSVDLSDGSNSVEKEAQRVRSLLRSRSSVAVSAPVVVVSDVCKSIQGGVSTTHTSKYRRSRMVQVLDSVSFAVAPGAFVVPLMPTRARSMALTYRVGACLPWQASASVSLVPRAVACRSFYRS